VRRSVTAHDPETSTGPLSTSRLHPRPADRPTDQDAPGLHCAPGRAATGQSAPLEPKTLFIVSNECGLDGRVGPVPSKMEKDVAATGALYQTTYLNTLFA